MFAYFVVDSKGFLNARKLTGTPKSMEALGNRLLNRKYVTFKATGMNVLVNLGV